MSRIARNGAVPPNEAARPTSRGWALLVASVVTFILAYSSGRHELLFAACLLLLLPVAAFVLVRSRKLRLTADRSFAPHIVPAGSVTTVTIDVQNVGTGYSPSADWRDFIPWRPFSTTPQPLPALSPRRARFSSTDTRRVSYDVRAPRRGYYEIGPLGLQYGDPFGLVAGAVAVGEPQPLIVIPEVVELPESGLSIAAGDGSARLIQRRATGNDDDLMTREYRMGDALRRVHWRASARHGELMVRQEEQRTFPEARLIVETRRSGYSDVSSDNRGDEPESESFEWAVQMVASLGVHLHRSGFLVHVIETGPKQIEPLGEATQWTGRDEEFLISLAEVELVDPPSDEVSARQNSSGQGAEGSLGPVFAVLGSPDAATVKWLARQRRPYELAVVFVRVTGGASIDYIESMFGVEPTLTPTIDYLENAGWIVVPVRGYDTPASAWLAVMSEAGVIVRDPA